MKVCKVRLSEDPCLGCIDRQIDRGEFRGCDNCYVAAEYELLKIGVSTMFRRDYAMVLMDGKVKRVPLDAVYDIREV